jgi:zinc/manganese transport system substrate-binding protein
VRLLVLPLLLALALVAGCGDSPDDRGSDGGPVGVVATTTILGDLARAVGGERADVRPLLQPSSDPHDYEPRPDDVVATADADVVVTSGLGLDAWMADVVEQSGGDARVVDVGADLPVVRGEDPHWWHDPRNAAAAVATIRDVLARANPDARVAYARNAAAYLRRLRALDAAIAACVNRVPPAKRKLVTDHDAFGYLADRYGIEVVGTVIPSLTTQAQPSAGDLAELARTIEREGVTTVFAEQSVNPKLAEAIARESNPAARVDDSLFGDTLGPAGSDGATYLAMEAHNADAIVRGLRGGRGGCPAALAVAAR